MVKDIQCEQLDVMDYFKVRINQDGKIIYVDDAFLQFSGYDISELILEPFYKLMWEGKNVFYNVFAKNILHDQSTYFIALLKKKDGKCFWTVIKSTPYTHTDGSQRFLLEIKMLPTATVNEIKKVADAVLKIEEEVGVEYAEKYFEGLLEEKGMNFNEFIFDLLETTPKKLDKYFTIKK